jgi:phage gp45-like
MINLIRRVFRHTLTLDTPSVQAQVESMSDELHNDVESVQTYGFNAAPVADVNEGVALFVNGQSDHGVIVSWIDKTYRPAVVIGEVQLYAKTDAGVSTFTLKKDGSIRVTPANGKIVFDADMQVNGRIDSTGDMQAGTISLQGHKHPQNIGNHFGGGVNTGASVA